MKKVKLLDTIATLKPIPIERLQLLEADYTSIESLPSGQVGTIVEVYEQEEEYHYLVEFADTQGSEYAMATLRADEILVLHYDLAIA
ncbi:DUF4926 domain-containing protein [Nostoc sphaeroides]|jgi:hypothetical protein|uniref:DUF4926 domain-containing protein n=1 Tax=Nostoc sphaeroides CCNUC1 TaxID=2653204 RepID=A0A5P8VW06_9NOSO|nr:DUF4926 domain-containing protein [Nostoc sphaeroides]MCC5629046.1 DUF4926 domain-containing protein [Nostoc sphaeroides CHAB 2801]QFS44544.1 hypothetical protein GXM_02019 [Nostoc sphaeroides CCNUC1]